MSKTQQIRRSAAHCCGSSGSRQGRRSSWVIGLVAVAGLSWGLMSSGQVAHADDASLPLGAELLREAIRVRTVSGEGGERVLAEFFASRLAGLGIEARVIPTPDESGQQQRAALWARLPGAGLGRPVVLLSHLDVVRADAEDWTHPPFEGEIDATWVHGRGALDSKGITVAHILAMLELAGSHNPLPRDVGFNGI